MSHVLNRIAGTSSKHYVLRLDRLNRIEVRVEEPSEALSKPGITARRSRQGEGLLILVRSLAVLSFRIERLHQCSSHFGQRS